MNPKSAEALVGMAIFLGILGGVVMNPTARYWLLSLAAVLALIPTVASDRKGLRIVGIVVSVITIAGATWTYPEHERVSALYQKRLQEKADKAKATQSLPPAKKQ